MKQHALLYCLLMVSVLLGACSRTERPTAINEALLKPPSLSRPIDAPPGSATTNQVAQSEKATATTAARTTTKTRVTTHTDEAEANVYIVLGIYRQAPQAFAQLRQARAAGLTTSTIESRSNAAGIELHRVRAGPYADKTALEKAQKKLIRAGISGFKVVSG